MTLFQRLPRGGHTRSLSEHGSQALHRRWYLAHGPGRVGRRWIRGAPCLKGEGLLFFIYRPASLRSRDHARSIPGTCRSRPLSNSSRAPFFIYRPASFRSRGCRVRDSHPEGRDYRLGERSEYSPTRPASVPPRLRPGNARIGAALCLSVSWKLRKLVYVIYFEYFAHLRRSFSKRAS